MVSGHTSGASQHAEVSDGGRSTPARPQHTPRVSMGPARPLEQFSTGKGQWRPGAVTGGEGQRGLPWRLHLSRVKEATEDACEGRTREETQAPVSRGQV